MATAKKATSSKKSNKLTSAKPKKAYPEFDRLKNHSLDEALKLLSSMPAAKFDESVDVALNLGVDPKYNDQMVRGVVSLPHGNGKTVRVAVFAEGAAKAVATALIARLQQQGEAVLYDGFGTCYIEFGAGRIGKVEVDFFSGPKPTGNYYEPSTTLRRDKEHFGASRRARWFGL